MKGDDAPGTEERNLLRAQIEQCYGQLPIALAANVLNGAILTAVLWATIETVVLLGWFALLVAVSLARLHTLRTFRAAPRDGAFEPNRWKGPFRVGAFGAGLVWGLAGIVLFHPESFPHQVLLAFLLGGMVAGAIPLLSAVRHAYPLFAIPVALASITRMVMVGDTIHLTMGLIMGVFSLAMLASSAQVRRIFRESESLRRRLSSSIEESQVLEELIRRDALTGIPNRRLFEEQLQKEWRRAERDGLPLAIISADIDHFKKYNDRYGHQAGDKCLIKVAQAMQHALSRPGDIVARMGGEEFAFLLPGTTPSGAQSVAEQVRRGISGLNLPHEGSPVAPMVTVSMGIASSGSQSVTSPAELLHASDVALYEAKRRGRNQSVAIDQ
ncbi:GGDEF domain-containing protein [Cognatazoarcus halotolerans]|uniref:GGDEF domain-containing protein n=1 Tax=Cognatazoarcus halotolerans TaxID=2686016 RepID=UPI00135B790D|nr:diguanylate cyclase [Cognatazoarcus halotolerans]MCB1901673.1 diguanylate cyclase [Rhodocyclaceae bacterium]MCP5310794.1 diguanylate cyclase [Zoogloeaceae bacterium]